MAMRRATIPAFAMFTFQSQAAQFPAHGALGVCRYWVDHNMELHHGKPDDDSEVAVDCLVYRAAPDGRVQGILYYYVVDHPPLEKAGNVNLYVDPDHQREGIGTMLLHMMKWLRPIDFDQQRYTQAGLNLVTKMEQR